VPPIYQTSTFVFDDPQQGADRFAGRDNGYIYTRLGNPTIAVFEQALACLEGGYAALATASGMAATSTILFGLLEQGAHVVASQSIYGATRVVLEQHFGRFGVTSAFVDTADLDQVSAALQPSTRLLFVETPANPALALTDIAACAEMARKQGALLAVDNTFASPILQRPLELGAHLSLHSVTKFINGHSDVVGGIIIVDGEEHERALRHSLGNLGGTMDPHQAWLALRGSQTLALRVRAAQANAQALAAMLDEHPAVASVSYPGLPSHPQYQLGQTQMKGPGCLISFELRGGYEACVKALGRVELCRLTVSLGGVESLIQHPASMTHSNLEQTSRLAAGITDGMIRLSVGCEDVTDLKNDLKHALEEDSP
jgi:methionine-gamma-lyase